ncbi:hypothetical protein HZH68_015143 [Vespula germanica]|uniref:Uncharacterized protein n=1 Tax=Vespula germanica TaxID=30212 RepID=A0A834JA94_VESGE|nr:hypothetical protein HZH68_015143 [Vespula germanica]
MSTTALSGMQDGNKQMGALWKSDCTGNDITTTYFWRANEYKSELLVLRRGTYDIKYLKCNVRSGVRFSM